MQEPVKPIGESDWEDQDLLSHEEAGERLRAEIAQSHARLAAWRFTASLQSDDLTSGIAAEEARLALMETRLAEIERTLRTR